MTRRSRSWAMSVSVQALKKAQNDTVLASVDP
jgi:hypothetical protein